MERGILFLTFLPMLQIKTLCSLLGGVSQDVGMTTIHENRSEHVLAPVDVFDSDLIQRLFISQTRIANENDNVLEQLKGSRPPVAIRSRGLEFSFRFIVPQRTLPLRQKFDLWRTTLSSILFLICPQHCEFILVYVLRDRPHPSTRHQRNVIEITPDNRNLFRATPSNRARADGLQGNHSVRIIQVAMCADKKRRRNKC